MTTWSIPPDTPVEWGPSQGAPSSGNVEWDSRMRQRASASSGRSSPVAQSYIALRCPLRSLALLCVVTIWSSLLGIAAACSAGGRAAAAARPWTLPSAADSDAVGAPTAIEGKPARRSGRCICFDVAFFFPVDIRRGRVKTPHGAFSNSGSPSPRPERQGQAAGPQWRQRASRVAEGPCGGPCAASAGVAPGRVRVTRCERQADRPTGRPTSRQTYSNIILAGRQAGRQTDSSTERQADRQTDRQARWQTDRPTDRRRQTDRRSDRPTDRPTGRRADRQTHSMHAHRESVISADRRQ